MALCFLCRLSFADGVVLCVAYRLRMAWKFCGAWVVVGCGVIRGDVSVAVIATCRRATVGVALLVGVVQLRGVVWTIEILVTLRVVTTVEVVYIYMGCMFSRLLERVMHCSKWSF